MIVIVMPSRSAQPSARSANVWRHSATATATLIDGLQHDGQTHRR